MNMVHCRLHPGNMADDCAGCYATARRFKPSAGVTSQCVNCGFSIAAHLGLGMLCPRENRPPEVETVTATTGADVVVKVNDTASPLDVQEGGDHYKKLKIQPVEYIHANGIGYFEGNVIKYVTRWRDKNGAEDLKKARHYLDLLIELEQPKGTT